MPALVEESWLQEIGDEFEQPYMRELLAFLSERRAKGVEVYPPDALVFNALNHTPLSAVKVVILGQDPYHGEGQAHGLSFSVADGVKIPPSLRNICKELAHDLGFGMPSSGSLLAWAEQGVLLLNAVLTVEKAQAGSHQGKGWEVFTDAVIKALNEQREHIVFVLWGSYAQQKGKFIDRDRHLVLSSVHPSPLSAHRGFFGSQPFSKCNAYLREQGIQEVDWRLDSASLF